MLTTEDRYFCTGLVFYLWGMFGTWVERKRPRDMPIYFSGLDMAGIGESIDEMAGEFMREPTTS